MNRSQVKEAALIASGRHCSICHIFCELKIEVHHILQRSEGGDDSFDNAIPVCFNCHADMRSYDHRHPKGTKYTPSELKAHRDRWYEKVRNGSASDTLTEHAQMDRRMLARVTKLLPWNGSISFVRTHNFEGSFHSSDLVDLDSFLAEREDPAFEFIDPDLEGLRATLAAAIQTFRLLVGQWTFRAFTLGDRSVPAEWEEDTPERFQQAVGELGRSADIVCENYDQLIKMARRKLSPIEEFDLAMSLG
jgi:hypothetical protein